MPSGSRFFLGVDGGQSSTIALIGDVVGNVCGYGRSGPCNHVGAPGGLAIFTSAIENSISVACAQAGLDFSSIRFEAACLGFSGGPADKEPILHQILNCDRMTVTNDALIALVGATAGEPGVIVIAGTGSIAYGRNAAERTARAGGWGYIFGDEGGAFDIARQALRAALRFEEGWGSATNLHKRLLQETAATDVNAVLHSFYTTDFPRDRIASLARLVDKEAANGDVTAAQILESAAQHLATFARAVRGQLFSPEEAVRVAYIGGVFRSARLLERFRTLIELEPENSVAEPIYSPAAGALLEAYRSVSLKVSLAGLPDVEKR